ncbi:MAG: FAD-linked oxidase C-terminal domain-containing protein [Bacteroidota bacterium]
MGVIDPGIDVNLQLSLLADQLEGELHYDRLLRTLYATDASVYRELPLAVAFPRSEADLQKLVRFAAQYDTSLIPRTAGTSLAGQCVGSGIVVDTSRYLTQILELNLEEKWVRVQPGVIRDELNDFLRPHGYFFAPNTSTANRCMIGGMVGNNSCGTTSIVYGSTREHVLELRCVLSDGEVAMFGEIPSRNSSLQEKKRDVVVRGTTPPAPACHPQVGREVQNKKQLQNREGAIYRELFALLEKDTHRQAILDSTPKSVISRRNTGYALDMLAAQQPFDESGTAFNICTLLCGSEGTLALTSEVKLNIVPLPPPVDVVVAVHCRTVDASMRATQVAMSHSPSLCELMDDVILNCTAESPKYRPLRAFVVGEPKTLLVVELRAHDLETALTKADKLVADLKAADLGYAHPIISGPKTAEVWQLRAAGLGLLANLPGDRKAVACIEDTAVSLDDLPSYIADFEALMKHHGQRAVYYAHAGAGELHLRPILDLKKTDDREAFYDISHDVAKLVKKYNGSLSGEHGDGRVRAPFIELMVGPEVYGYFRRVKQAFDPLYLFNPGKIIDAPPMNETLRYEPEQETQDFDTILDFSAEGGLLRLAEKCNGSGDCRKLSGVMCPSYQATRFERDSTRGRANVLREMLTRSERENPFTEPEIKEALDLCLSCKGCTGECPSLVDMTSLKAEVQHQRFKTEGVPMRSLFFGHAATLNRLAAIWPGLSNLVINGRLTSGLLKQFLGVASERRLPQVGRLPFLRLNRQIAKKYHGRKHKKTVYLLLDEFVRYNEPQIGHASLKLLWRLGYAVEIAPIRDSARAQLSKGLLPAAQRIATANVQALADLVGPETPLLGIEPSAILGFRDEYLRLTRDEVQVQAKSMAPHCLLIDEFLHCELEAGCIAPEDLNQESLTILLHGHCHQKALSSVEATAQLLDAAPNFHVQIIPTGCCGMAGSFGYEQEHYALSQQIGEMVLFPAVRAASAGTTVVATGTSCRHQIEDGVGRKAVHWVEIL